MVTRRIQTSKNKQTNKQMKNKSIKKTGLLAILALGIMSPYIYAQCVSMGTCNYTIQLKHSQVTCIGGNPAGAPDESFNGGIFYGGGSCGLIVLNDGTPTAVPCGSSILSACF